MDEIQTIPSYMTKNSQQPRRRQDHKRSGCEQDSEERGRYTNNQSSPVQRARWSSSQGFEVIFFVDFLSIFE
ncbi:hypothetical protein BDV24DRAFT_80796 [Aspergillus arachidicola]|uniref:Uncharacterized protein n=1 Tax=Aspergillus arachidicola TaxID=656916 RepID=A0A5N6YNG7_9EURO|nr:hypothetical protein BDV24DRAFT_80796 [Aspergillus arachidicola]